MVTGGLLHTPLTHPAVAATTSSMLQPMSLPSVPVLSQELPLTTFHPAKLVPGVAWFTSTPLQLAGKPSVVGLQPCVYWLYSVALPPISTFFMKLMPG